MPFPSIWTEPLELNLIVMTYQYYAVSCANGPLPVPVTFCITSSLRCWLFTFWHQYTFKNFEIVLFANAVNSMVLAALAKFCDFLSFNVNIIWTVYNNFTIHTVYNYILGLFQHLACTSFGYVCHLSVWFSLLT